MRKTLTIELLTFIILNLETHQALCPTAHISARALSRMRKLGFAMARLGRGKSELQLLPAQPSTMHTRAPSPERKRDEGHSLMDTTALSVNAVLSPCSI